MAMAITVEVAVVDDRQTTFMEVTGFWSRDLGFLYSLPKKSA